jgi:hypothetical protein
MVESFAMGVSIPVKPIDDFQPLLIEWNRESSTGKFAPTTTKADETCIGELQAPRRVLLSETPIEAVWARLAQLKSATLARKMVDRRAQLESLSLEPSTIVSKGEGVAFALRNATDYFGAIDRRNVSQRVLNLYYGTMSFAFTEMLASPGGPQTLSELEETTKKGHGLYTHDGLDDRFESKEVNHVERRVDTLRELYKRASGLNSGALLVHIEGRQVSSTQVKTVVTPGSLRGFVISANGSGVTLIESLVSLPA